ALLVLAIGALIRTLRLLPTPAPNNPAVAVARELPDRRRAGAAPPRVPAGQRRPGRHPPATGRGSAGRRHPPCPRGCGRVGRRERRWIGCRTSSPVPRRW